MHMHAYEHTYIHTHMDTYCENIVPTVENYRCVGVCMKRRYMHVHEHLASTYIHTYIHAHTYIREHGTRCKKARLQHVCISMYTRNICHPHTSLSLLPAVKKYGCCVFQSASWVLMASTAQRQNPSDTMYAMKPVTDLETRCPCRYLS
jgi:hypothetical protein